MKPVDFIVPVLLELTAYCDDTFDNRQRATIANCIWDLRNT